MTLESKLKNKRLIGLDYLKVLAILMVITLHVRLYRFDFIESGKLFNVVQYALRLITEGVPLFLITNGFLLFRKEHINYKDIYKKAFYYFCLYLFFGALTILIVNFKSPLTLNDFMNELLTIGAGKYYVGSLWFIQSLIATYLIFPVIHYIYKNNYSMFKSILGVVAFFSVGQHTLTLLAEIFLRIDADYYSSLAQISYAFGKFNPFSIATFLLFFLLGAYVHHNFESLRSKLKLLWLLSILGWFISIIYAYVISYMTIQLLEPTFLYGSIFMAIQVVTVFITFLSIPSKKSFIENIIQRISSLSLWIYFVHNILIYLYPLEFDLTGSFGKRFLLVCIIFVASIFVSIIIQTISQNLVSKKKRVKELS